MSDEAEDRDGTGDEVTEQDEQQTAAWSEPAAGPRWSEIASEADVAGSERAGADPGTAPEQAAEPRPATEAARSRRPSSLRSAPGSTDVPPRRLTSPSFPLPSSAGKPAAQSEPGSNDPVSEPADAGRSGQMPNAAESLLDKVPMKKLQELVKARPEAGLGLAFIGGLLIATLLRRLAR